MPRSAFTEFGTASFFSFDVQTAEQGDQLSDMYLLTAVIAVVSSRIASGEIDTRSNQEPQQVNGCLLDPVRGPCQGLLRRYFYNPVVNECREFFYSGCGGNTNNYLTKLLCEAACRSQRSGLGVSSDSRPLDCKLPIDSGTCRGYFIRWAFNGVSCQQFIYGGCGGNWNRFDTIDDCETTCGGGGSQPVIANPPIIDPQIPQNQVLPPAPPASLLLTGATLGPVCTWPVNPGPCRGFFPKWGFQSGRCVQFVYGGCGGNSNRFDSLQECEQGCSTEIESAVQSAAVQSQVRPVPPAWCPPIQQQAPPVGCEMQPVTKPDGCPGYEIRCSEGACASNPCKSPCEYCVNDPVLCPPGSLCLGFRCLARDGCPAPLGTTRRRSTKALLDAPPPSPCSNTLCPTGHRCEESKGSAICVPLEHSSKPPRNPQSTNGEAEQPDGPVCACGPCEYCIYGRKLCPLPACVQQLRCEKNHSCITEQCTKLSCTHGEICQVIGDSFACLGYESTK